MSDGSPVKETRSSDNDPCCAEPPADRYLSPTKRPREEPKVPEDERSTQEDDEETRGCGTPSPPSAPETANNAMRQERDGPEAAVPETGLVRLCAGPFCAVPGGTSDLPRRGRVVCLDVETTGLTAADSVVEIGAVELIDGVRTGLLFQTYLLPRTPISSDAKMVHGLDEPFLKEAGALPPRIAVASFIEWVGRAPCVSHNASFDSRMLNQELVAAGYQHTRDAKTTPVFCTMTSFHQIHPEISCSLDAVARYFQITTRFKRAMHSALTDAEICAMCYQRLLRESSSSHV